MRFLLFFSFVATITGSLLERFENWVNEYQIKFDDYKNYETVFDKWESNHRFIEEINSQNLTYKLGHNQFSGMNSDDFKKYLGI